MLCFGDRNLGGAHSASPTTGEREREREKEKKAFLQEKAFDQGLEKSVGVFQDWENENTDLGTSLMVQCLRLDLPIQGVEV